MWYLILIQYPDSNTPARKTQVRVAGLGQRNLWEDRVKTTVGIYFQILASSHDKAWLFRVATMLKDADYSMIDGKD